MVTQSFEIQWEGATQTVEFEDDITFGELENILKGIDDISFIHLTSRDIVRHRIVQAIVDAYEKQSDKGKKS